MRAAISISNHIYICTSSNLLYLSRALLALMVLMIDERVPYILYSVNI